MQGDEGYKIVGNIAIEAKSNSTRIRLLNVLVSQFNTVQLPAKRTPSTTMIRRIGLKRAQVRGLQKIAQRYFLLL